MLKRAGQAIRTGAGHSVRFVKILAEIALLLVVLAVIGLGGLGWRLSQGPLELDWAARRIEAAVNADDGPTKVSIGGAALVWEGFRGGVDRPLDVRVTGVAVTDADGRVLASLPQAEVSLSTRWLLLGRIIPCAVDLHGLSLRILRAADGELRLDLGSLLEDSATEAPAKVAETQPAAGPPALPSSVPITAADTASGPAADSFLRMIGQLARPPASDRTFVVPGLLDQLRRVRIADARILMIDEQLGLTWRAPQAEIDLQRLPEGGVSATARLGLALGSGNAGSSRSGVQTATLNLEGRLDPQGGSRFSAKLTEIRPADLAGMAPSLAPLKAVDAPVLLSGEIRLDSGFVPLGWTADASLGGGKLILATGEMPLSSANLRLEGQGSRIAIPSAELILPGASMPSRLAASGVLEQEAGGYRADLALLLDQVNFADLAALWPSGMAGGARNWVTGNITAGTVRDASVHLKLEAPLANPENVTVAGMTGRMEAQEMTLHWLRPMPPVERVQGVLTLDNPDQLTIETTGGKLGALIARESRLVISGLATTTQVAAISVKLAGPVAEAVTLIKHPRLKLLERRPLPVANPGGTTETTLTVKLPLEDKVTMDQIAIEAQSVLSGLSLPGLIAGRDLDQGAVSLSVDNNGLKVAGKARVAGIPADLTYAMDFGAGAASQVIERASLTGRADERALESAGLPVGDLVTGTAGLRAGYTKRRDGRAELTVRADLLDATLKVEPLDWAKKAGIASVLDARMVIDRERIVGIEDIKLEGPGAQMAGRAEFAAGKLSVLRIARAVLGKNSLQGEVRFPARPGDPWRVVLSGAQIDLTEKLTPSGPSKPKQPEVKGDPWTLEARFEKALLAHGRPLGPVTALVTSDGLVMREAHFATGGREQARFDIVTQGGVRQVSATSQDAGVLLNALGVIESMQGGRLNLTGRYDDTKPDRPLTGTARIEEFRVRNAPALAQLLKAMTLYGVLELAQGSGLSFTQLVAPFSYTSDLLVLEDARAFSPSLGLTAKGRVDLDKDEIDLQGTVVPAYFFNTLLGNIPLIGRLFSPEQGGGLFAATYSMRGKTDDPKVGVNPLAALTPGFLRGMFGIFDQPAGK